MKPHDRQPAPPRRPRGFTAAAQALQLDATAKPQRHANIRWRALGACALTLLAGCASGPPPADWQINAHSALAHAMAAYLGGDSKAAASDLARARAEIARSGRTDLAARAELMQCAAQVASLQFEPCEGFERLRADAPAPERAYADYLAGRGQAADIPLLPAAQRGVAAALASTAATAEATGPTDAAAGLQAIDDPLSRLLAAGISLRAGRAGPATVALAVDTASAQGWRRPLLAWLGIALQRAELAGDNTESERLKRRIALVQTPR